MKKTTQSIFTAIILFFTFSNFAFANTIDFDSKYKNEGNIALKIQKAINEASNGDVILFNSSYYDLGGADLITINKPVTLKGATTNGFNTSFYGASGIQTTLGNTATIEIRSNNVMFVNISIVRKNQGESIYDILIDARHTTYLVDNPITVNQKQYGGLVFNNVVLDGGAYSFHSGNGVQMTMTNVSMVNWRRTGFWANRFGRSDASPKMIFDHCLVDTDEIVGFDDRGFSFDAGNSEYPVIWDFNNTTIKDSKIINTGIALSRCENMTIEGCTFEDKEGAIDIIHIEEFSNNVRVRNNVFDCKVEDPYKRSRIVQLDRELQITSNVSFTGNRIVGQYNFFISSYAPNNITITGNDFTAASAANPNSINLAYYESRDREPINHELVSNNITIKNNPGLGYDANNGFTAYFPKSNAVYTVEGYTSAQKNITLHNNPPASVANGIYEITNKDNGQKLAASSNGFGVVTSTTSNENSQWKVTFVPPYSYTLQNVATGRYMETHLGYTEFDIINNQPQNIRPFLNDVPTNGTKPFWAILDVGNGNFEIFPGGNERQSAFSSDGSSTKLVFTISIDSKGARTNIPLTNKVKWSFKKIGNTTNDTTEATSDSAPIGSTIALRKTGGDKKYISAVTELGQDLYANQDQVFGDRQKFKVEAHPSGNGIALKSIASNKYLQIINGNNNAIVDANANNSLTNNTLFKWTSLGANKVALKSLSSNLWLQAPHNSNLTPLFVKGQAAKSWETFEFSVIANTTNTNKHREISSGNFSNNYNSFSLSPSVTNNNTTVTIQSNTPVKTIVVYNMFGQVVLKSQSNNSFKTDRLTSGMYLVQVNGSKTKKLIIN